VELQLANLHGDIVATATTAATGSASYSETTEYGLPRDSAATNRRYGWLGAHQRNTGDTLAQITLMGVRLYNPTTGRFLSIDPVAGGSCNAYEYTCADPVNGLDLDGKKCWKWARKACGVGQWAGRTWREHKAVRWATGVAIVAGAAAACGLTWGIACAAAAGAAYGALKYCYTTKRRTRGGYARATAWGGITGAAGAAGKLFTTRWIGNASKNLASGRRTGYALACTIFDMDGFDGVDR